MNSNENDSKLKDDKPTLRKKLNEKIQFIIVYIVLITLNCIFGLIQWGGLIVNVIMIIIIYFIIIKVEGMYKYG